MDKNYIAQLITVKGNLIYKISCRATIKDKKIIIKSKRNKKQEYEIKNISEYSNEKLISLKEESDLSFSMLMSFASAIFIQLSLVFSVILLSMALYDVYKKRNYKYVILSEGGTNISQNTILNLFSYKQTIVTPKRVA